MAGAILLSLIPTLIAGFFLLAPKPGGGPVIRINLDEIPREEFVASQELKQVDLGEAPAESSSANMVPSGTNFANKAAASSRRQRPAQVRTATVEQGEDAPIAADPDPVPKPETRARVARQDQQDSSGDPPVAQQVSQPRITTVSTPKPVAARQPLPSVSQPERARQEPAKNEESSDTEDVREALRDIRPR